MNLQAMFNLVTTFSDGALALWVQYVWSLRWTIGSDLPAWEVWSQVWKQALACWDSKHKNQVDLWNRIHPANPKRIKFLQT